MVNLTKEDIKDLKKQGYSDEDIAKAVQDIDKQEMEGEDKSRQMQQPDSYDASSFSSQKMDDMAKYQLELNDLLEQTEHILKGDVMRVENGQKRWKPNPHPEKNALNSEGIREIMLELQTYVNRHIILGDYDDEDIRIILRDYGKKLNNLIFMKYDELGMDTDEKRQKYESIVTNVVNMVFASYSRAKDGGERRSLREMIQIQQSHQSQSEQPQQIKSRGILNPLRYFGK